jgi:non-structural maintenance of chromosomes element 1
MADFVGPEYNDNHRAFLQALLARSTVTFESAKPLLAAIESIREEREVPTNDVTQDVFNTYIAMAKRAVGNLDLDIRETFHQTSRERIYALVNTTSDPMTQLATSYNADEIAFIKKLLDAMFDGQANTRKKEAMCLSTMDVVQLNRGNRRETQNGSSQASSKLNVEKLVKRLIDEGWLEKSRANFHTLSPRALMELRGWLVDTYNEPADEDDDRPQNDKIKFCEACHEIITMVCSLLIASTVTDVPTQGQRCSNRDCLCRLHDICTQTFFRIQRAQRCPLCKADWDGKHYVGERAITMSEKYHQGTKRSARVQVEEDDDDSDEDVS